MNPLEHALDYPFGEALPAAGDTLAVAPGIAWVRMALPFALDHVHLYLLRDTFDGRDGWTAIDTGIASDDTRARWEAIIGQRLGGLPIVRVLCTHMHPDHVGLAAMLTARFDCPLWMTPAEYAMGRLLAGLPRDDGGRTLRHLRRHGVPEGPLLDAVGARSRLHFSSLVPEMPTAFTRIREDEPVRIGGHDWRVILGSGHSPEHASLYCERWHGAPVLLAGDMVLPRISTNVAVWEIEPEANPVQWYLRSLARFEPCSADTLVLPAHGRPFAGLHTRIAQLADHHADRLAVVLQACRQAPRSAAETVAIMFGRQFDAHQGMFALGEALAHLQALAARGELGRRQGDDGVVRFGAA